MDLNIQMPAGYILLANHKNKVILAQSENKETPEPYVTWLVSNGSDVHTGSYFASLENAEHSFCERAFPSVFCTDEVSDLRDILRDNQTVEELKEQYRQQARERIEVFRNCLNQYPN